MIYLGLDLGSKTLGVSISDRTGIIATSLEVIRYNNQTDLLDKLDKIVEERKVDVFILGNPLNLNGTISTRTEVSLGFKKAEKEVQQRVCESFNECCDLYILELHDLNQ